MQEIFHILLTEEEYFSPNQLIIRDLRLPKTLTAILAGASLSVSGLQMQTLFRNPLAGPYVLGISAGASLGVALMVMGGGYTTVAGTLLGSWALIGAATVGAVLSLVVMMQLACRLPAGQNAALLIAGLMFGSIISAIVNILEYFASSQELQRYVIWGMGSLTAVDWLKMKALAPFVLVVLAISVLYFKPLDALYLGELQARAVGVSVDRIRQLLVLLAGALAGAVTAFCGPISFVGLAAPHIARLISVTSKHSVLLPLSAMVGACLLLLCDILCYLPTNGQILPLNAITSLIGAPLVIWLVLKRR